MYSTKLRKLCVYCHSMEHLREDYLELLAKLEEKRGPNIHMVIIEPHNKPIDPTNVRVITQGGVCIRRDMTRAPLIHKMHQPLSLAGW